MLFVAFVFHNLNVPTSSSAVSLLITSAGGW
jgi:hypothetical protein